MARDFENGPFPPRTRLEESLYVSLRDEMYARIYRGEWRDGERLPAERSLAEGSGLSRVTVRKSLKLLEDDGLLVRTQGSGTTIRLRRAGYPSDLDIIALLAPAQEPFFAQFLDYFQRRAEEQDSLVLFMRSSPGGSLEDCLFRLFQRGIRNAVVWAKDLGLGLEAASRLRGLGINMVLFDAAMETDCADCVLLDNALALRSLHRHLRDGGASRIGFVGWDNMRLSSAVERERAFRDLAGPGAEVYRLAWDEAGRLDSLAAELLERAGDRQGAWLCADGSLGVALGRAMRRRASASGNCAPVATVDDFTECSAFGISAYRQDFKALAEKAFACLVSQAGDSYNWRAAIYRVAGELVPREAEP
jgi:DNA-binding LacI/PurR family transcriptional regulator